MFPPKYYFWKTLLSTCTATELTDRKVKGSHILEIPIRLLKKLDHEDDGENWEGKKKIIKASLKAVTIDKRVNILILIQVI